MKRKSRLKIILVISILLVVIFLYFQKQKPTQQFVPQVKLAKFAVFSDIHSNYKNLQKALEYAKNNQSEFIVITGDLTTMGNKSELIKVKNILDENDIQYYAIPGNHDLWFSRRIKTNVWLEVFGSDFQSFKIESEKFILINNAEDYVGMSDKQWQWLTNELKDCPQITCLVFMHEPLNHPSSSHIMGEQRATVASQAANLFNLFITNQVKEIITGHLHFSSHYEIDGIKTTIIGAVTNDRNPQLPRFLQVSGEDRKEIILNERINQKLD